MKILMLLSKSFITDDRVYKEAKALVDAGNEITVIEWDRKGEYKSEDIFEGIKLVRIRNSSLMKILHNDIFRNPFWWRAAYKKGLKLFNSGFDFSVVHCHDLDTLQIGVWLKKKIGCQLIYDAHEIFGYMISESMPKSIMKFSFWMEKRLIKYADHVITVNKPVEKYLESINAKQITIIMNCKNLITKTYQPPPNKLPFTVCYIGGLIESRMFPDLIDIIGEIKDVKFVVAGFKSGLYEDVKKRCEKYDNVEFLGQLPSKEAIPKTLESNAIICLLDPKRKSHQIGITTKIFEAMVTGRPIIVTKNMYNSDEFVEKERCGLSVLNNRNDIQKAIVKLRDDPKLCENLGKNGLRAAMEKYNWDYERKKLLEVYEDLK